MTNIIIKNIKMTKIKTTKETKLIRTIYLYVASLISLLFVAIGTGTIANTTLKMVFPKAEKAGYSRCDQQPPVYDLDCVNDKESITKDATEEEKKELKNLLADYDKWKTENSGEECYIRERQRKFVDGFTMLLVALPIFLFHWMIVRREKNND